MTDITEHPTREGKVYCCVVLDTFSRRVVGWAIDSSPTAVLPPRCSPNNYSCSTNPVLHQPVELPQYTSLAFTEALQEAGITGSIGKFAELFHVSVDYLLVEDAPRRPFRQAHDELGTRLADLDKLSDADRAALLHILDGLLANTRIRAALDNAG